MNKTNINEKEIIRKILLARLNLLAKHSFFGVLLLKLELNLDYNTLTAYTDGKGIYLSPSFINNLTIEETSIVLLHELMHVILKHVKRMKSKDNESFNVASDIVVNSNIMYSLNIKDELILNSKAKNNKDKIKLMHLTPNNKEGYLYTAEEVYMMLRRKNKKGNKNLKDNKSGSSNKSYKGQFDDHSKRISNSKENGLTNYDIYVAATEYLKKSKLKDGNLKRIGNLPLFIEREIKLEQSGIINWRILLREFIEYYVNDYSFSSPDRRYLESPFFMSDFNEVHEELKNIVFLIDVSGSISRKELDAFITEIYSITYLFNDKLEAYLGLFDTQLKSLTKFTNKNDLDKVEIVGGGGTSLVEPLKEVFNKLGKDSIKSIVILTDGNLSFLNEEDFNYLPHLWIITNLINTPPHGKVARLLKDNF